MIIGAYKAERVSGHAWAWAISQSDTPHLDTAGLGWLGARFRNWQYLEASYQRRDSARYVAQDVRNGELVEFHFVAF